jgi:hypothetical protein
MITLSISLATIMCAHTKYTSTVEDACVASLHPAVRYHSGDQLDKTTVEEIDYAIEKRG